MKKIFLTYITLFLFFAANSLHAQQNMTLYDVNETGQSVISNPAAFPDKKVSIGIPFLSGISAELAISGFRMSDLLVERPYSDSLDVDVGNVLSVLDPVNYSSAKLRNDIFFGGVRIKDNYLSFGMASSFSAGLQYPSDLVSLMWHGNARFYDELLDFSDLDLQLNHYLSYHIGYSLKVNNKLRLGARLKYLQGISNIYLERFNLQFIQKEDPSEYNRFWFRTDMVMHTSGLELQKNFSLSDYFSGKKNPGFAVDLGVQYQVSERLNVSASATDLGKIKWQTNTRNYQTAAQGFFEGITLDTGSDSVDYYNDFIDSLKSVMDFKESGQTYSSRLPARYAFAMKYRMNEKSEFGFLTGLTGFSGFAEPYLRFSYTHKFSDVFLLRGSYGIKNRTYGNIGLGAVLNAGPLQIFAFGDNIAAVFSPWNARMVNLNVGINILL